MSRQNLIASMLTVALAGCSGGLVSSAHVQAVVSGEHYDGGLATTPPRDGGGHADGGWADGGHTVHDGGCTSELGCAADAGAPHFDAGCDQLCVTSCGTQGKWSCESEFCAPISGSCGDTDAGCQDGVNCETSCGSVGKWSCTTHTCAPPAETCGNGEDDDCNGLVDCDDPACAGDPSCPSCIDGADCTTDCGSIGKWSCDTQTCTPPPETCGNGADDDCNGLVDCDDPACASDPSCPSCIDGADCTTDCGSDGKWSCDTQTCTPPPETCGNGADDDCNGLVDCDDPACAGDPTWCPVCVDGTTCTTDCGSTGTWSCADARCVPPAETCGNGTDDDCNGLADCDDPACAGDASCCSAPTVCGVIGCNGDMGQHNIEDRDTDGCWQDPGGCTPENLDAWCTRRGDTSYLWPNLVQQSVEDNCSGTVQAVDPIPGSGYGEQWQCIQNGCLTYTCNTPLVLAFDPAQVVAYDLDDGRGRFDLSSALDGSAERTDWPKAATPWLAMDRDGDGRITSGRELFGSATLVNGKPAHNGFEALAALDANHDGVVDARDPDFAKLRVWTDANGDRQSTPDELKTLPQLGVTSIAVRYDVAPRCDARGNCEVERAGFTWTAANGAQHTGAVIDIHLRTQPPPRG